MNLHSAHAIVMMPRRGSRSVARTSWLLLIVSAPSRALDWMLASLAR